MKIHLLRLDKDGQKLGRSKMCLVWSDCFSLSFDSDHMENIYGYLMKYTNLVTGWQYR